MLGMLIEWCKYSCPWLQFDLELIRNMYISDPSIISPIAFQPVTSVLGSRRSISDWYWYICWRHVFHLYRPHFFASIKMSRLHMQSTIWHSHPRTPCPTHHQIRWKFSCALCYLYKIRNQASGPKSDVTWLKAIGLMLLAGSLILSAYQRQIKLQSIQGMNTYAARSTFLTWSMMRHESMLCMTRCSLEKIIRMILLSRRVQRTLS